MGRLAIESITPTVHNGQLPAKAVPGELIPVSAVAYREGHDAMGCFVVWRGPDGTVRRTRMNAQGDDTWHAAITPDQEGRWTFQIEAFSDPFQTWSNAVRKKIEAGQGPEDLRNDLATGVKILHRAPMPEPRITAAIEALEAADMPLGVRVSPALGLHDLFWANPVTELTTRSAEREILAERERALFSAWYEFFPRSEGAVVDADGRAVRHGTFRTAADRLPGIARMGFDIVYLPPIHPIGRTHRKGRDNALVAEPADVGSPWAIGAAEGGHDAIHPELGTLDDFRWFLGQARENGLEVALDLALQCSPDHPWVAEHPEWFTTLPDGTIAYAENPPKKYQDIYPLNFDNDPEGIRAEILRVVRHWVRQGVRVFRVDNPHTKPIDFWHWLIGQVRTTDPDVLFLAEAFTKPTLMRGLGAAGFTQSYTYFTWRTGARELRDYCEELVRTADVMRPSFWPTTPDILHESLQHGGPPMFKIRAVLAALLSPSWGIYSGYELYEHVARPGVEEFAQNEKYQLRPRAWARAEAAGESLAPFLTRLNEVRNGHPALRRLRNLRFHDVDNDQFLCWSKMDSETGDTVIVVCSLDSHNLQWGNTSLNMPVLGYDWHERFDVVDQLTGERFTWGQHNAVRLDPFDEPAHILVVQR
ncbi:alpha-1,4-glucan--maltose-1-phosphate maltosyltransferase [Hamadaea tsunoensis]|uniref:alpha-1,4-glucan--maltose-1-phosphate maltosyltransferase n=1 Tax=Hamadaea tsunoensis TaxID=53368 RepID=UPI000487D2A4|nr:alpha-1,4-glucan--maltose-1-phosphate maltosyltransferase [Hamadaea tsunoensis]